MPLVPAKCPECGGNININSEKRAAICEFCKQPFVVEDAINNFNTTYNITNNNEIKADVVNVYENREKDFVIKAGELVEYQGESTDVIIPEAVLSVKDHVFSNTMIRSIVLPRSIKKIGDYAFENCRELKSVSFNSKIFECGIDIFNNCNSIEQITHNTIEFTNIESWENYIRSNFTEIAFCFSMKNYKGDFPKGVEKIVRYDNRFRNPHINTCRGTLSIPNTITEIAEFAFYGAGDLTKINLPEKLTFIGEGAFSHCYSLKEIKIPGSVKCISNDAFSYCTNLETVIIEEGVEYIGNEAFLGCTKLFEVRLPNSIKKIGNRAFSGNGFYDNPGYLRRLSVVEAPENLIKNNIAVFEGDTPFFQKMSNMFCPKCGGDYSGVFKKVCNKCGYRKK